MNITQGIRAYLDMTKKIQMKLNWKADKRIAMILASVYILNRQNFQYNRFAYLIEELHHSVNKSGYMSKDFTYFYATVIDVHALNLEGAIPYYLDVYGELKKGNFPAGKYTYLSSFIVGGKSDVGSDTLAVIHGADDIYQSLKQRYRFTTDARQYPFATMRAAEKQSLPEHDQVFFYQQLKKRRFSRGRNLLSLSQILTLDTEHDRDTLVQRAEYFFSNFIDMKIDPRPSLYPLFGLLALLPAGTVQLALISEIHQQLNQEKLFRHHKDISALLSVILFVDNTAYHPYLVDMLIYSIFDQLEEDAKGDLFNFRNFLPFE